MMTQTRDVPTTQQTTAMIIIPVVVDSSSNPPSPPSMLIREAVPAAVITTRLDSSFFVPSVLDIMQVYFPESLGWVRTIIRSWLFAVKKCRWVTSKGRPSFCQLSLGFGLPEDRHSITVVSPSWVFLSSIGLTNDGVSVCRQRFTN